jgi:hypothetical protein
MAMSGLHLKDLGGLVRSVFVFSVGNIYICPNNRGGDMMREQRGTQWGTWYSKRPLYAAKSETCTRS